MDAAGMTSCSKKGRGYVTIDGVLTSAVSVFAKSVLAVTDDSTEDLIFPFRRFPQAFTKYKDTDNHASDQ